MKHGLIVLALLCWFVGATQASEGGAPVALTLEELEAIEGGDLFLNVDRDKQVMTVTQITPGNYENIQCYSVGVTTSVVREKDVSSDVPKGAMENGNRVLAYDGGFMNPKQFPSGTASLNPTPGTQANVSGLAIRTNATQLVTRTDEQGAKLGQKNDSGYNIHYVDPAISSNTWGCIGVQSQAGMNKVLGSLATDNASYAAGAKPNQTVTVTAYTNNTPPPASTFKPTPAPKAAPVKAVAKKKKKK